MNEFELDWLKRWDLYSPEAVALVDGDSGRPLTYRELYRQVRAGAQALKTRFQIGRGDRVAVLATNELEYVVLFFALQRLGATMVPVNFRLTAREVDHIVDDSEARLIIYQEAFSGSVAQRKEPRWLLQGPKSFAEELQKDSLFSEYHSQTETPAMILYTSGTTGNPKGAILSLRMLFWNSLNITMRLNLTQNDKVVTFAPFFHTGGWNVLTTPLLHRGAQVIITRKFDADQVLELSEKHSCTILFGVPTTMDMMARSDQFPKVGLKSMRYAIVGGEPMPIEVIRVWHEKGIPIRQGYGLTEFGPNVFSLNEEDAIRKIGSIGFPNFYIDAKVVNDQGRELGDEEVGELALRGPMMMTGYWKNDAATSETIRDGWLYTGDLVRRDREGYYYVVGRKKDMFISGGENVYPVEVEQVLRQVPGVREVAVIGIKDTKWGEVGKAYLSAAPGVTEEVLKGHCLQHLAKFKIPKHFAFLPELPKSDSGKILKKRLRELSQTETVVGGH